MHTAIEEELFYPAFLDATGDTAMHHEAIVEHAGAKKLIAEIRDMSVGDDFFDAKVTVLSEMIKHHVKEEEQPGGHVRRGEEIPHGSADLGEQMRARKEELQSRSQAA